MSLGRTLKYLLLLAVIGGGVYAYLNLRPLGAETKVALGNVQRADLVLKVTVAGGVVPRHKALITPPYNGYIKKLFVRIGDQVKVGSPVVSIAQTVGAGTDEDVFPLRSPLTGEVVQVWKSEGEYVSATATTGGDATLVRIDDKSKLFVEAGVPEIEIGKLKIGQPVVVRALAVPQKSYNGKITQITLAAREGDRWDRSKVEFPITVELSDPDEQLKPGMSAVVDVIVQEAKGVLTLRHEYVQKIGKDYFVTGADGKKKQITVGLQNEDAFEVKSGLAEGEAVRMVDFLSTATGG